MIGLALRLQLRRRDQDGDEGAANHTRLRTSSGTLQLFAWGRPGLSAPRLDAPRTRNPARHGEEASRAVARLHLLSDEKTLFWQQGVRGIDGGAFHTDVLAVGVVHEVAREHDDGKPAREVQGLDVGDDGLGAVDVREHRGRLVHCHDTVTELEQAENFTEAIQQFREVGQVRMTPQVRFHIAFCEEGLGRLVTALGGYDLAFAEADTVGPEFKTEVETAIARLRERIPKLFIERGEGADAALVQLDGVDLGASSIGVEVPLDPGPHKVTATAPGYHPYDATVELKEREITKVTLDLVVNTEPPKPPPPPQIVIIEPDKGPDRTIPYIVGGAGIAFLAAGGALYALARTTKAELDERCPDPNQCGESNRDTYDRYKFYNTAWKISGGVGLAAVGTAVVLILTEKKPDKKSTDPNEEAFAVDGLVPIAGANGSVGAAIFGSF